jgi:hypothetical protein
MTSALRKGVAVTLLAITVALTTSTIACAAPKLPPTPTPVYPAHTNPAPFDHHTWRMLNPQPLPPG